MATVSTVLAGHAISTSQDFTFEGKSIRFYSGDGRTVNQVQDAITELESEIALGNTVLGGSEPDYVMIQSGVNQTMVVR